MLAIVVVIAANFIVAVTIIGVSVADSVVRLALRRLDLRRNFQNSR